MKKAANIGSWIIKIITGLLTVVFALYGILMIWDMYRTELKAFATYDLMKYRPNIEENEPPYLDDLLEINKDTTSWLTIYNTNIDYPVMHGKDDMEYINKDVYGEYSISGSIFMASQNATDYSDPYTLVYGHHMANGSMFGDVIKFKKKAFFEQNDTGVLILPEKVYDLKVMAVIETDAYDHDIYWTQKDTIDGFTDVVKSKAKYYRKEPYEKILALSTCDDATTMGRTVLICAMTTRTDPLPDREYGTPIPHREAVGHPMAGAYWALLDLIILIFTVYFGVKMAWKGRKKYIPINLAIMSVSVLIFILTEDMHKPIQIVDKWTPVMLLVMAVMWGINKALSKRERSPHE